MNNSPTQKPKLSEIIFDLRECTESLKDGHCSIAESSIFCAIKPNVINLCTKLIELLEQLTHYEDLPESLFDDCVTILSFLNLHEVVQEESEWGSNNFLAWVTSFRRRAFLVCLQSTKLIKPCKQLEFATLPELEFFWLSNFGEKKLIALEDMSKTLVQFMNLFFKTLSSTTCISLELVFRDTLGHMCDHNVSAKNLKMEKKVISPIDLARWVQFFGFGTRCLETTSSLFHTDGSPIDYWMGNVTREDAEQSQAKKERTLVIRLSGSFDKFVVQSQKHDIKPALITPNGSEGYSLPRRSPVATVLHCVKIGYEDTKENLKINIEHIQEWKRLIYPHVAEDELDGNKVLEDPDEIKYRGTGKKKYKCPYCETRLSRLGYNLERHVRKKHPKQQRIKKWKCDAPKCSKSYFEKEDLVIHQRKEHQGERLACPICEQSYKNKRDWENHNKKIHSGEGRSPILIKNDFKTASNESSQMDTSSQSEDETEVKSPMDISSSPLHESHDSPEPFNPFTDTDSPKTTSNGHPTPPPRASSPSPYKTLSTLNISHSTPNSNSTFFDSMEELQQEDTMMFQPAPHDDDERKIYQKYERQKFEHQQLQTLLQEQKNARFSRPVAGYSRTKASDVANIPTFPLSLETDVSLQPALQAHNSGCLPSPDPLSVTVPTDAQIQNHSAFSSAPPKVGVYNTTPSSYIQGTHGGQGSNEELPGYLGNPFEEYVLDEIDNTPLFTKQNSLEAHLHDPHQMEFPESPFSVDPSLPSINSFHITASNLQIDMNDPIFQQYVENSDQFLENSDVLIIDSAPVQLEQNYFSFADNGICLDPEAPQFLDDIFRGPSRSIPEPKENRKSAQKPQDIDVISADKIDSETQDRLKGHSSFAIISTVVVTGIAIATFEFLQRIV